MKTTYEKMKYLVEYTNKIFLHEIEVEPIIIDEIQSTLLMSRAIFKEIKELNLTQEEINDKEKQLNIILDDTIKKLI